MKRSIHVLLALFLVAVAVWAGVVSAQRRPRRRPRARPPVVQTPPEPAPEPDAGADDVEADDDDPGDEESDDDQGDESPEATPAPRRRGRAAPRPAAPSASPAPRAEAHGSITDDLPCSACHTPEGWNIRGASGEGGFDHASTGFPLTGRHRMVGCTECHAARRQVRRDCVSCHQDPHQGRMGGDCVRCHSSISWTDTRALEIHRLTRLPLTGMHAIAACTDCHRRTGDRQLSAVPAECISCHQDEYFRTDVHPNHSGSAGGAPFPRNCALCHRTTAWSPAIVDPTTLGRTSAPLVESPGPRHELRFPIQSGRHSGAACTSCHEDLRTPAAVRCTGCHEHNPMRILSQHTTVRPGTDGRACLACHPGGRLR